MQTAIEILEEVFTQKYPNGTFAFVSEVQGDKDERYRDKITTTPFCLLTPDLTDDFSAENGQFTDRFNFRILLLESNTDNWKTKVDKENNIVAPLRIAAQEILTKVIYQYPDSVTTDVPFNAQGTSLYDWGSGHHVGIGYRFSVNQMNELNICSDPITYELTTTVSSGGTLEQNPAGTSFNKGDLVSFCAEADEGFAVDTLTVNGTTTANPFSIIFNQNKAIVLDFIAGGLSLLMQIFDSTPVQRGLSWFFGDHSTNDNDVEVGNVQVGKLLSGYYIDTNKSISGLYKCTMIFNAKGLTSTSNLIFQQGFLVHAGFHRNANAQLLFYVGNNIYGFCRQSGDIIDSMAAVFDGSGATNADRLKIYINGVLQDLAFNGTIPSQMPTLSNNVQIGYDRNSGILSNGLFSFAALWNDALTQEQVINYIEAIELSSIISAYAINHGQGSTIYNLSDPTDGTVVGANLTTFWSITVDGIQPWDTTLGATLYQNDGDNTIMTICKDTSIAITGFTRLGYFPAGSGALKGLPNKYFISGVDAIIAEGWYTIEELIAYESANVVITQDANTVSLFKVLG